MDLPRLSRIELPAKLEERAQIFARDMRKYTREFRYGSVRMPVDMWGPWRDGDGKISLDEFKAQGGQDQAFTGIDATRTRM